MAVQLRSSAQKDQRGDERQRRQAVISSPGGNEPVTLVNVSQGGVRVRASREFAIGADLVLKPDPHSPIVLVYAVRSCTREGNGFEVGAQYVSSFGAREKLDASAAYATLGVASRAS
jgi:hypothetical protein